MSQLHPLRSEPMKANVLDMGRRFSASDPDEEIEISVATVTAVGEMLDRMQTQIEKQATQIAGYQKEVRDLSMSKDAAYEEVRKAETAMRAERERAERNERMYQQASVSASASNEKVKRLIAAVRTAFGGAEAVQRNAS